MADESAPSSIAERIAALKLSQVGRLPGQPPPLYNEAIKNDSSTHVPAARPRPPPPPPPRPELPARPNRTQSINVPPVSDHAQVTSRGVGNLPEQGQLAVYSNGRERPPLPVRTSTQSSTASQGSTLTQRRASGQPAPALPQRRPSEAPSVAASQRSRRDSNESVSSIATARSSVSAMSNATSLTSQSDRYRIRAPEYDPTALPPLPPNRTKEEKQADARKYAGVRPLRHSKSSPKVQQLSQGTTPPPSRENKAPPPALPGRPARVQTPSLTDEPSQQPARIQPTLPQRPRKSALSYGLNESMDRPPPMPSRHESIAEADDEPPPLPVSSKPDLAALQASKPKANGASGRPSAPQGRCMHCRDFSGPDDHAARFPRQSVPSSDLGWLAHQLTSPFPSLTDKARAIFTWLHHNVEYDVVAFFNNNVQRSTPQSTLQTGLAVCEGYAALFTALAVKVGLESIVIGGHGKGYGHSALEPGDPVPPYSAGHAWNAVRIDDGEWKLLDACWGAGAVGGPGQPYKKIFTPERFTQSNNDFGLDHFPEDSSKQFRTDGRAMTWSEYILGNKDGCGAAFFSGYVAEEGLARESFQPTEGAIALAAQRGPMLRFSFQKICPHWDPVRCGKGPYYLYTLALGGLEGTERNHIPFETNGDVWWCDVPVRDLGRPGQDAQIWAVTSFDNKDARGLTIHEYRRRKGRVGMGWAWVCKWMIA